MTPISVPLDALLGYVSNSDQDTLREILEHTLQALIEAEAATVVGARTHERTESRVGHPTGTGRGRWTPEWAGWSWTIPKLLQQASCPACWSLGVLPT